MFSAQMAEHCARIAWEAFVNLTKSEVAAQEAIAGTPLDFEAFAVQYLVQAFMAGKPGSLAVRIDHESGHRHEDQTGDFHFGKIENVMAMTYAQANAALMQAVPTELRLKFKRLHAHGATPFEAYSEVVEEWEKTKAQMQEAMEARSRVD